MILPTPKLALWLGTSIPLVLLTLLSPELGRWVFLFPLFIFVLALIDATTCGSPKSLEVHRITKLSAIQGHPFDVQLDLLWRGAFTTRVRCLDHPPTSWRASTQGAMISIQPQQQVSFTYKTIALRRGITQFEGLVWRTVGRLGFIERTGGQFSSESPIKVFPDLAAAKDDAHTIRSSRTLQGLRQSRFQGEGSEFHQLRDYVAGDDLRDFDWKAFAHRGVPTIREHRMERHQRLLLVLDAGRLMTTQVGVLTKFDWAVHAAGRLSRAATLVGDSISIAIFKGESLRQLPSGRGPVHLQKIANFLMDVTPSTEEGEISRALPKLLLSHPRRSLVVVFSELSDPRHADLLVQAMGRLTPKHLGLLVTQVDLDLEAERKQSLSSPIDVYQRATAIELYREMESDMQLLKSRGVEVVRAPANRLASDAVTKYIDLKRRKRL